MKYSNLFYWYILRRSTKGTYVHLDYRIKVRSLLVAQFLSNRRHWVLKAATCIHLWEIYGNGRCIYEVNPRRWPTNLLFSISNVWSCIHGIKSDTQCNASQRFHVKIILIISNTLFKCRYIQYQFSLFPMDYLWERTMFFSDDL